MNLTKLSSGYQFPIKDFIKRDDFILTIQNYLTNNKIIFIEGDSEVGKTTLNLSFCAKHNKNTISIIFNPLNKIDYQLEFFLNNAISQLRLYLGDDFNKIINDENLGLENYQKLIYKVRKKLKNESLIFLIDGLEELSTENIKLLTEIIDLLPLGDENIKIILTGSQKDIIEKIKVLNKIDSRSLSIIGFSETQVLEFLGIEKSAIAEEDLIEIVKLTNGYPGKLSICKKLITEMPLKKIIESEFKNLIEIECEKVDLSNTHVNIILSLLSLKDNSYTLQEISKIINIDLDDQKEIIDNINVLEIKDNNKVYFQSLNFKKYFKNLLRGNEKNIDNLLIKFYSSTDTIHSKIELSELYANNKQWNNLIGVIDENFLIDAINTTESLNKVNDSIELAYNASNHVNNNTEILKYSIQGSIINELENITNFESEILARISIQDFSGAIALAESAILKINRLNFLSLIARKDNEINSKVDEDLMKIILDLYRSTDFSNAGDKIYDIVSNLMYVLPSIALEIIENSSGNKDENNINDWIVAKLSIASINSETQNSDGEKNKKLIEKLENKNSRKISRAINFLVGNYSSEKVLDEVKKISDSKERLKLLRIWLSNNKKSQDKIENVIETAFEEMIKSSSNSIHSLDVLKDLTYQLPYIKRIDDRDRLYKRFLKLDKDVKEMGLDRDKIVYELNLFHAQFSISKNKSIFLFKDIIDRVKGIEDTLVRLELFCEIYSRIKKLNSSLFNKNITGIKDEIISLSDDLLSNSANHYNMGRQFLKGIAIVDIEFALEILNKFNTQINRERSRLFILDKYLENNLKFVELSKLDLVYASFETEKYKNLFYKYVLERFSDSKSLHFTIIEYPFKFISAIENSSMAHSNKIYCFVLIYIIVSKNEQIRYKKNRFIKERIEKFWEDIEDEWNKVDIGFYICSEISKVDTAFSKKIFNKSEKLKNDSWISSENISKIYSNSLSIVIKAYQGLVRLGVNTTTHYKNIETLVNRIPSQVEKLNLWTEICFNILSENKLELTQKIYNEHILPLLQDVILKKENSDDCIRALIIVHYYNPDLAIEYINKMEHSYQNLIFNRICEFYITKKNPYEIYDDEFSKYNCTQNEILKTLSVLERINSDIYIYEVINTLYRALIDRNNNFTPIQRKDIVVKLNEIIEFKLPDVSNIKHNGYKIISKIKILLIEKNNSEWNNLYEETKLIPNLSDRLLVKSSLLEFIPFDRFKTFSKNDLYEEIILDLKSLNNNYEFIERTNEISSVMYDVGRIKWKELVTEAVTLTKDIDKESISYKYQKSLLDTMFRLDHAFSKEILNSLTSSDESNKNIFLKEYYAGLEISKKIKNNQTIQQKEKESSKGILRGMVNAVASFNSGKLTIRKPDELNKYLNIGYKFPLNESLALYHYYFLNCNKHIPTKNAEKNHENFVLKLYDETIKATNLIEILATKRKNTNSLSSFNLEDYTSNLSTKPGSREEALKFIQNWMNDEMEEFLIFADPYLEAKDIELLKLVKQTGKDNIEIHILGHEFIENTDFEKEWNKISQETIPFVNVTFCNISNENKCPFHDRWIITKKSGLRIGTSFNSVGINKEAEISIMKATESENIYQNILKGYFERSKREFNFQRVTYKSYSI